MKRWLLSLVLLFTMVCYADTPVHINIKDLFGNVTNAYVEVRLMNCGAFLPLAPDAVRIDNQGMKLYTNNKLSVISFSVPDETTLQCGTTTGSAYYQITIYEMSSNSSWVKGPTSAYDFTGTSVITIPGNAPLHAGTGVTPVNGNANQLQGSALCLGSEFTGDVLIWTGTCWQNGATINDASWNIESPTTYDSGTFQHRVFKASSMVELSCDTNDGGSASISLEIRTQPNVVGMDVLSTPLVCSNTYSCTTHSGCTDTFSSTLPAGSLVALKIFNASTSLVRVHAHWKPLQ